MPRPKIVPLTLKQLDVVTFIEQYWNEHGKFPKNIVLEEEFTDVDLDELTTNETFIKAIANRGIKMPGVTAVRSHLSQEQVAAVAVVVDFNDKRSVGAKLKSMGVNTQKWNGWLQDERFKDYLHSVSSSIFQSSLHVAQEGLIKSVENGDTAAIKFYMELTGRYHGDQGTSQNIKQILALVVESIQRHVKDPEVIRLIAADFEVIMSGRKPVAAQIEQSLERMI